MFLHRPEQYLRHWKESGLLYALSSCQNKGVASRCALRNTIRMEHENDSTTEMIRLKHLPAAPFSGVSKAGDPCDMEGST